MRNKWGFIIMMFWIFFIVVVGQDALALADSTDGRMNLFAAAGWLAGDYRGMLLDLGFQYRLGKSILGEFLFDYYLDPWGENTKMAKLHIYSFNLNGVYRRHLLGRIMIFAKAGVHRATNAVTVTVGGESATQSESNWGINVGSGLEFPISQAIAFKAGLTWKKAIQEKTLNEGKTNWWKFFIGVNLALKKGARE